MSTLIVNTDYIVSCLRRQIQELQKLLLEIEKNNDCDSGFIKQSLRRIESNLHKMQKL